MQSALSKDAVDAVSIWQPWGQNISVTNKDDIGVFLNEDGLYPSRILLATTEKVMQSKPEALRRLIEALKQAEKLYDKSPQRTHDYLAREIGTNLSDISTILERFRLKVEPGSLAKPLVKELGEWISKTQENFSASPVPTYDQSFDDRFFLKEPATKAYTTNEEVAFCRPNNMVSALFYIAQAKALFEQQGINPTFQTATNAKICQDLLLAGKADYMIGGEGPFTYLAASSPPLSILAMVQENPETSIFARRDRGIEKIEDLRGKKIGYLPGTVSYFFLSRVMRHHKLNRADLTLISMQPPTMPAALVGGSIDAFSMWEPWGAQATNNLKGGVINLTATDLYKYRGMLIARNEAIKDLPLIPARVLKALIAAERFITDNDSEAFSILSKAIVFDAEALKRLWPDYRHRVRIEVDTINLMIENFELLKEEDFNFKDIPIPDFKGFIDSTHLRQIAPERVEF